MLYLASYNGKPNQEEPLTYRIKARIGDNITRFITRGPYSHCELVTPLETDLDKPIFDRDYLCYSASIRDKGVRKKIIHLKASNWVLYPLSNYVAYDPELHSLANLETYFQANISKDYDLLGALGIILGTQHAEDKMFCSEFVAGFLGLVDPWRYHPNLLEALLRGNKDAI